MTLLDYLHDVTRRLTRLGLAWAAALTFGAALLATALGGWLVMVFIPSGPVLLAVRLLLGTALLALLVVLWRRRPDRRRATRQLEARVPDFDGRLATWLDAAERGEGSDLLELLARQTRAIAARHPPSAVYPARRLLAPSALALGAAVLLAVVVSGNHPWQLAAQRMWVGDLLADSRPRLLVEPGDVVVRRGSDVVLQARAQGFRPDGMEVSADFGNGWEQAPMAQTGDGEYGFVLVGVSDTVEYYVASRGLTSARHRIQVADLPRVTGVETVRRFPAWTGRADTHSNSGDVTALPGTRVRVRAFTDRPVAQPVLVVDGEAASMTTVEEGEPGLRGTFDVSAPGSWHIAVRRGGELARISDSYLIELAEDAPPEVAFTWPGHDTRATAIEEVTLGFEASDDYGVEALTLRYAVNGGAWQEATLDPGGEHLLRLETLRVDSGEERRALAPGDVISFYGEARDHSQSARSSLYFVDVRPFDMRYRESQQMGGQQGAEGGGFDIAERQRDILSATWNLINKRGDKSADEPNDTQQRALADEAHVLAMLQRTLQNQVTTLVERSAARGLGREGEMSEFIAALARSLEHMEPAAERLEALQLDEAVPAEQRALAHLSAAEASVRDVDVSLTRNQGRGTSGRSLAELMELEMDPARNRYEMPQRPELDPDTEPSEPAGDWQRLDELAARQERLARRGGDQRDSLPARWEQARLQRELEQLRQELAARRASGAQRGSASAADAGALERAIGELDRASRSLERPASEMPEQRDRPQGDLKANPQDGLRAASQALRRAADTLRQAAQGDLEQRLGRAQRQVSNLKADQTRIMEALHALQRESLEQARAGEPIARSDFSLQTFAEVKRRMQEDLAIVRGELTDISGAVGRSDPATARLLDRAISELDDARLDERLAASAEAFEMGQPLYVIGSEGVVEQALERLGRRADQAMRGMAQRDRAASAADPLDRVRELRRRLDDAEGGGGALDREAVTAVARELGRLAAGADAGPGGAGNPAQLSLGEYHIRGTDDNNTETLMRLTREQLDLVESMLTAREALPIRAQEPREAGRDSSAAARYFRALSRTPERPPPEGG